MRTFLFCLSPTLLAYLALLAGGERMLGLAIILIILGSGIVGSSVASHLHRIIEPKGRANVGKGLLGIAALLATALGYLAIAGSGCGLIANATR